MYPLLSRILGYAVCSLILVGCANQSVEPSTDELVEAYVETESQKYNFDIQAIDARSFVSAKAVGQEEDLPSDGGYYGGIVPHHDVAYEIIDRFYQSLEVESIDGIVLIGPDHQGIGDLCTVARRPYRTHFGVTEVSPIGELLVANGFAAYASDTLQEEEHSIGLHMNYIAYYYPNIPVIPLFLQDRIGVSGAREVLEELQNYIGDGNYLFIGSVDFSHGLNMEEANQNDLVMSTLIEQRNYDRIFSLGDAYIDSSAALFMAIEGAGLQGSLETVLLEHSNSAIVLKNPSMKSTTSYYTIGFK